MFGSTAAHVTAQFGGIKTLKLLLASNRLNMGLTDINHRTPFDTACVHRQYAAVTLFLDEPHLVSAEKKSTSLLRSIKQNDTALTNILLNAGAEGYGAFRL